MGDRNELLNQVVSKAAAVGMWVDAYDDLPGAERKRIYELNGALHDLWDHDRAEGDSHG